jgi:FdhD protein
VSGDSEVGAVRTLAPEARVRIRVNQKAVLEWSCTPVALPTLAAGWLVSEGVVRETREIRDVTVVPPDTGYAAGLEVELAPAAWRRLSQALSGDTRQSIGPAALPSSRGTTGAPTGTAVAGLRRILEDRERVAAWFRDMFDQAALRESVGGVHTGGLIVDGRLAFVVEDVSRHHVVDRLVGSAFLAGISLHGAILLVSARISGAMASKACRAGVGALVSRSVPTELAASVAETCGLLLVGRAQREQPHYYWPEGGGTR